MSHCRNGTPCWCLPILLEHDLSPYGQKSRSCFTTKQSIIWGVHAGQSLFEVAIFCYAMGPNATFGFGNIGFVIEKYWLMQITSHGFYCSKNHVM